MIRSIDAARIQNCLDKALTHYTCSRDERFEAESLADGSIPDLGAAQEIADMEVDINEIRVCIEILKAAQA